MSLPIFDTSYSLWISATVALEHKEPGFSPDSISSETHIKRLGRHKASNLGSSMEGSELGTSTMRIGGMERPLWWKGWATGMRFPEQPSGAAASPKSCWGERRLDLVCSAHAGSQTEKGIRPGAVLRSFNRCLGALGRPLNPTQLMAILGLVLCSCTKGGETPASAPSANAVSRKNGMEPMLGTPALVAEKKGISLLATIDTAQTSAIKKWNSNNEFMQETARKEFSDFVQSVNKEHSGATFRDEFVVESVSRSGGVVLRLKKRADLLPPGLHTAGIAIGAIANESLREINSSRGFAVARIPEDISNERASSISAGSSIVMTYVVNDILKVVDLDMGSRRRHQERSELRRDMARTKYMDYDMSVRQNSGAGGFGSANSGEDPYERLFPKAGTSIVINAPRKVEIWRHAGEDLPGYLYSNPPDLITHPFAPREYLFQDSVRVVVRAHWDNSTLVPHVLGML